MSLLQTHQLVCGYDDPLVGPLDLAVPTGAFLLIEGPNGIGKSTILKTLVGLLEPIAGSYDWSIPRSDRRFVPQVLTLDPVLPATVADVVATGALRGGGLAGLRRDVPASDIQRVLGEVQMEEITDHLFRDLSEGQKQLVLLARALLGDPDALLLDEPTASMDPQRERRAIDLLARLHRDRGTSIFIIAHGSEATRRAADARLVIDESRNVEVVV